MAWGVDEEARADVVGTASARLLAAGVPRPDRTGAMRLLGVLSASADGDGLVRRPLDDLAAEFDLPSDRVDDWLDALVDVDIVQRGIGVLRLAGVEPPAAGGLRLADFLATAAATPEHAEPEPEPEPLAPRRRHRVVRPVPALAAAAAVAAVLALVPALDRGPETTPVAADRPPATQPAPTSATTVGTSTSQAAVEPDAPLPVVVPTTTTTSLVTCPVAEPLLEVIGVAEGTADGLASVQGTAANPSAADLRLDAFTVVVEAGGQVVEVAGLLRPLVVPAGETVRWSVRTLAAALPGATAGVQLEAWHWADPAVERACG